VNQLLGVIASQQATIAAQQATITQLQISPPSGPPSAPPPIQISPPSGPPSAPPPIPTSCLDILQSNPLAKSGYYAIATLGTVYCDMETHGGGWTLCANWIDDGRYPLRSNTNNEQWKFWLPDEHDNNFPSSLPFNATSAGINPYLQQGGQCEQVRSQTMATSFIYACSQTNTNASHSAATPPSPIDQLGVVSPHPHSTPLPGTDVYVGYHIEYAHFGYGKSAVFIGANEYPTCSSGSCCAEVGVSTCESRRFVVYTSGIYMEVAAGGYDGQLFGGWNSQFPSGMQGASCAGADMMEIYTDRYSVLMR